MKKQRLSALLVLTFLFSGFTIGFLFGRNQEKHLIHISVSAAMQTQPAEVTPPTNPIFPTEKLGPIEETFPIIVFPIDINTADKDTIMALPGIGEVLAMRILSYRNEHGNFSNIEQLMNVKGIGEKRMEEILDYITIGG